MKNLYPEFCEQIDFPMVIYVYETGKILKANRYALNLFHIDWNYATKLTIPKESDNFQNSKMNEGSTRHYNVLVNIGLCQKEIDVETNVILVNKQHIIIVCIEESSKHVFEFENQILVPRLYAKNRLNHFIVYNSLFQQEYNDLDFIRLERKYSKTSDATYQHVTKDSDIWMNEKSYFDYIGTIEYKDKDSRFYRLNRIPIFNQRNQCIGLLGVYQILITKEEYMQMYMNCLEENQILSQAFGKENHLIVRYSDDREMKIHYISNGIRTLGYQCQNFYDGNLSWRDLVISDDLPVIWNRLKEEWTQYQNGVEPEHQAIQYRILTKVGDVINVVDETKIIGINQDSFIREGIIRYEWYKNQISQTITKCQNEN